MSFIQLFQKAIVNNLPHRSMGKGTGQSQFRCMPTKVWVTREDACESMARVGCGPYKCTKYEILNSRTKEVPSLSSAFCCLWDSHALHSPTWLMAMWDPANGLMG